MEIAWLHHNPEHIHSKGERHSSCYPSFGRVESEGWRYKSKVSDQQISLLCNIPPSFLRRPSGWSSAQSSRPVLWWEDPGQNFRLPQGLWGNCRLSKKFPWKTKQSMNKPLLFWQQRGPEREKIFLAIRLWEDSMQAWQKTWLGSSAWTGPFEFGANQKPGS